MIRERDAAVVARTALEEAGGLLNMTQIAERVGRAKSQITKHAQTDADFPTPVFRSDRYTIYIAAEVDTYYRARRERRIAAVMT